MNRRLAVLVVLLPAWMLANHDLWLGAQQPVVPPRGPTTLTSPFTFVAAGDSILLRPVSVYDKEPAFAGVEQLIRSGDVAFTNFEFNVFDLRQFRPTPQAEHGGLWVHAAPSQAQEIKALGFDMVSRANNHAMDYGVEGLNETSAILDRVGLVYAGVGPDLGVARRAAYFQTPLGRVAMISTASSFTPLARASHARDDMKGRPGVSALRWTRHVFLEPGAFASLKRAIGDMQIVPLPKPFTDEAITFYGTEYRRGDRNRVDLVANQDDVNEILAQVRNARREADFVFVTIHSHEPSNESELPADFLPAFAHACIDAGADMFIGHGPHQLRGIEIYKDRPIFYSLGNFAFQYQTLEPLSSDIYEGQKLDPFRSTPGELYDAVKDEGLGFKENIWWEGAIAVADFDGGAIRRIEMHPIDLGAAMPPSQKGTPRLADAALSKKIIDRLARLSRAYGTTIRDEDGVGVVERGRDDR
ncbi:MAG: CapA family protein [Betaproteobacteria bacterium]